VLLFLVAEPERAAERSSVGLSGVIDGAVLVDRQYAPSGLIMTLAVRHMRTMSLSTDQFST
jgi:hypothetical protein